MNNIKFRSCSSHGNGGGINAHINEGGQLILDNSCEFYQCESRNGGGIYADINLTTQCSFVIKDALIHECEAITNDSLSYSQSGFGGGMFIGGSGDYNPISKLIDFRGMKIYNNSADKYGQSLFVVMTKVAELCKYGILGEYMKGNYSDAYSDEHDLIGIPMNLTEFNSSTSQTIEQQQKPLELLWGILGILKSASVIVNISNPKGKLIFNLEGQRMIPGQLKDGPSIPIQIEAEIPNDQTASFGMNDYKWLNYKQKIYGVLISNGRKIFTGKDGLTIEEDENAAVPLEVTIEEEDVDEDEDEKDDPEKEDDDKKDVDPEKEDEPEEEGDQEEHKEKDKGLPIGIIVGIIVGALAIVVVIIIIIIVSIVISKKNLNGSFRHEVGVSEDTLETNLLQDCHSPDAIYLSMDYNFVNITEHQQQQGENLNSSSSSSDPNFVTSWKLSDFEKIKKIGKGAFGTVWKMKKIKGQRIVAIKEVDYDSDEEKQRF
ncbi:MAG: hypothetical protein EZS28_019292, partial [Streblomastix strix]